MKVYKVSGPEIDWFVAASRDDALAAMMEHYEMEALYEGVTIDEMPDDAPVKVIYDFHTGECVTRTAAEWAAEIPRGLLCSTAY